MALTVDEAIARVPMWANVSDLKISPLGGGITNSNYRIDTGGESFVLRIAGADTELLGITREYEYAANLAAGELGIAPDCPSFPTKRDHSAGKHPPRDGSHSQNTFDARNSRGFFCLSYCRRLRKDRSSL